MAEDSTPTPNEAARKAVAAALEEASERYGRHRSELRDKLNALEDSHAPLPLMIGAAKQVRDLTHWLGKPNITALTMGHDFLRIHERLRAAHALVSPMIPAPPAPAPAPAPAEDPKPGDIGLSPEVLADIGKPPTVTDSDSHASRVLYPAIKAAMADLAALHDGFSMDVNRAYNRLFCAFWSEVPAPASAGGLRNEIAPSDGPMSPDGSAGSAGSWVLGQWVPDVLTATLEQERLVASATPAELDRALQSSVDTLVALAEEVGRRREREVTLEYSSTDGALLNAHSPEAAAMRTLRALGYEHTGGVEWRPPHGPAPVFAEDLSEAIKAIDLTIEVAARRSYGPKVFRSVTMPLNDWGQVLAALKGKVVREPAPELAEVTKADHNTRDTYARRLRELIKAAGDDSACVFGVETSTLKGALACIEDDNFRRAPASTADAFQFLRDQIKADGEYAWGWQSNIAMPLKDATKGMTHAQANASAAALMRHIFGVDMTTHEHYADTQRPPEESGTDPDPAPGEEFDADLIAMAPARPVIAYPARAVSFTLTHYALGDDVFYPLVAQALREMAEHELKESASSSSWPFNASNGMRVECEPWKTVDREDYPEAFGIDPGAADGDRSVTSLRGGGFIEKDSDGRITGVGYGQDANMADVAGILGDTPAGTVPTAHLAGASGIGSAEASKAHGAAAFVAAHPPKHVTPTVGCVMHYFPSDERRVPYFHRHLGGPYAAIVANVIGGGAVVNLTVFDGKGEQHAVTRVEVWSEGMDKPAGEYVCWPARKDGGA